MSTRPDSAGQDLPYYERPPLHEVVAGVQFSPLPLRLVDIGAFHQMIVGDYPNTMDVPALPPTFETFGPAAPQVPMFSIVNAPPWRAWFIAPDDEHLLQLQPDRLLANWRVRPEGLPYPRFREVRRRLAEAYAKLERLGIALGFPEPQLNQCELTYVNKLPVPEGASYGEIGRFLRVDPFATVGADPGGFTEVQFALARLIGDPAGEPYGRLRVECQPGIGPSGERFWQLAISVRGRPQATNPAGAWVFLDTAHVTIVRCFESLISNDLQRQWGKTP